MNDPSNDTYWAWENLARLRKVRLPRHATKLSTGPMQRWMTRLGITNQEWRAYTGNMSKKAFIAANPGMKLRTFVGLLLEYLEHRHKYPPEEKKKRGRSKG